ncbi:COMM domain-containing protein 8-like isoform X1 [Acipenser ruthenus]|uniref:COMM domain-containing protein 8-like isoform X1 n=1 Tax=Acipenser ruthenus TaxID=7906 RepID=UPI00145C13C2|nr:COMM domain-containing protein 8-like isoform X1 [Acipenser ruthenus]
MVKLLEKLPAQECPKLLHRLIDGVCGRDLPRFQDYGSFWSLTEWMEMIDTLTCVFKTAVGKQLSSEEVIQSLTGLSSSYQDVVLKCLKGRKEEIRQALVEKTNTVSSAQLQDFDWQLKLALSSDKISSLQTPLLNLDLDVKENGTLKPVSIEMNREELHSLINTLEAANKVVLQLK